MIKEILKIIMPLVLLIIIMCYLISCEQNADREKHNMAKIPGKDGYTYDIDTHIVYIESEGYYGALSYTIYINEHGNYCIYKDGKFKEVE